MRPPKNVGNGDMHATSETGRPSTRSRLLSLGAAGLRQRRCPHRYRWHRGTSPPMSGSLAVSAAATTPV